MCGVNFSKDCSGRGGSQLTHLITRPPPPKKQALRAAEAYGRRAILLRWGMELERVPLEELLVRNALRATRLGRYIPAVSIKV